MALKFRLAIATGLCTMITPALAGDSIWMHNRSEMLWQANGAARVVRYQKPRAGLPVSPGQVVFEGRRRGNRISGTAYTFRSGCAPAPYHVSGIITNEHRVVLTGRSPRRASGGCAIIGYTANSSNSRLVFTYVRTVNTAVQPPDEPGQGKAFVKIITRQIPGGKLVARIEDQGEPVSLPITIDADIVCNDGNKVPVLRKHRVCELDDITRDSSSKGLTLHERHYSGQVCDIIRKTRISYAGICQ